MPYNPVAAFNDLSLNANPVFIPPVVQGANNLSCIQDSLGLSYSTQDGSYITADKIATEFANFIKAAIPVPDIGGLSTGQVTIFCSMSYLNNAGSGLAFVAVSGILLFSSTTDYYLIGIDSAKNFSVVHWSGSSATTLFKISLSNFENSNVEFALKYQGNGATAQYYLSFPNTVDIDLSALGLTENNLAALILPTLPLSKLKLWGWTNDNNRLPANPATYLPAPVNVELTQADAVVQGVQNDVVAAYPLKFWNTSSISVPTSIENSGTNYAAVAIVIDNRNGIGVITALYAGLTYNILAGDILKLPITNTNAYITLNCSRWQSSFCYVFGGTLNTQYQTF